MFNHDLGLFFYFEELTIRSAGLGRLPAKLIFIQINLENSFM